MSSNVARSDGHAKTARNVLPERSTSMHLIYGEKQSYFNAIDYNFDDEVKIDCPLSAFFYDASMSRHREVWISLGNYTTSILDSFRRPCLSPAYPRTLLKPSLHPPISMRQASLTFFCLEISRTHHRTSSSTTQAGFCDASQACAPLGL